MPLAEPRSLVAARLTKPVAVAWAKKVPAPTSASPRSTAGRLGVSSSGRPTNAAPSDSQKVGRAPRRAATRPASGVVTIAGRKTR